MHFSLHRLSVLFSIVLYSSLLAAQSFTEGGLSCGADELRELRFAAQPEARTLDERLEQQWSKHAQRPTRSMPPPYTLPIVFHIVHNNGPENISDADILQSLEYTNQAFANTDYYDQGTGVATGIQFCLAQRTPENQATTGIDRLQAVEYVDLEATAEDRDMKDLLRWNPREYINVYVVREICGLGLGCGVAGYAYYPSAHGGRVDGIVVEARWLAGNEAQASVLVHELGHYLGIRHTFDGGCTNDDCTIDGDRVCDTPPDQSKVAVPCSGSVNSCSTDTDSGFATDQNDMFINYMDYGYWSCYSAFTQGQADRMYFFLDGIRASLLGSPGCLPPCPSVVDADFTEGDVTVEAGTTLNFTNTSTNGSAFTWKINDAPEATSTDFSWLFDTEGNFTITLFVDGTPPLCQPDSLEKRVRVICSLNAAFDPAGGTTIGVPQTFPNLSTLAETYEWQLDGTPISTDENLTYTFPSSGLFTLCLRAESQFCEETYCRRVYVAPPPDTTTVNNSGCSVSFAFAYRSLFDEATDGQFTASVPDGTGGYYAALTISRNPMVIHIAPDGNLLWEVMLFPNGDNGVIQELILDQEGQLAGIGRTVNGPGGMLTLQNFVFRIDPAGGNLLWGRQYFNQGPGVDLNTIIHPRSGAPYALFGTVRGNTPSANGFGGVFLQLTPANGDIVGGLATLFPGSSIASFERALYDTTTQQFRAVGYSPTNAVAGGGILLTTLSAGGAIVRTELLNESFLTEGLLDISGDNNGFAILANTPTGTVSNAPFRLYRFSPDGAPLAAADYYGNATADVLDLTANAQGYAIMTAYDSVSPVLTQLSTTGEVLWARTLFVSSDYNAPAQILTPEPDGGLVVGTEAIFGGFELLPYLIKVRPDGTIDGDCLPTEETFLERDDIEFGLEDWQTFAAPLQLTEEEFFWESVGLEFAGGDCREPCTNDETQTEICGNQIDDDADGFVDCDDPDLSTDCCCLSGPQRLFGTDTLRCGGISIFAPPLPNTRFLFTDQNGVTSDTLNEFPAQFLSEAGTYTITYIDTCLRTASDTITLHPRTRPQLDLGPDTTLCSNAVIPLLAQPGFVDYEWVDGSQDRSFTAYEAGTYWVIATDSCGGEQTDTVRVRIEPLTAIELGTDTLICPGDTLIFTLNGFTDYQWSQSSFIDCTNCPTVRFTPTTDTLLLVAAMQGPGCFASDSIRVRVASLAGQNLETSFCEGDTLSLGNQTITMPGSYLDTVTVGNCFRVDTVLARMLADTLIRDSVSICADDSTLIFGNFESVAGIYQQRFDRSNGCDSLVEITLTVNDAFFLAQTISICAGDSALIFGNFESVPGPYFSNLSTSSGCDSILRIDLEVNSISIEAAVVSEACAGADAGAVEVGAGSGLPPYAILWSSGDTTARADSLAAGNYTVTVTDANGCSASESITLNERAVPSLSVSITSESCPGANDGTLTVFGELSGQTFRLGNTPFGTNTFYQDLSPGDYSLEVQDSLGCNQTILFTIDPATGFFLDLPEDQTIKLGDSLTLVPLTNAPNPEELVWTINGTTVCTGCPTLTVRPEDAVTVTAFLPDSSACPLEDVTNIGVLHDDLFYIPNAFSPNDDGINDVFRVYAGPAVTDILRLAVYDRWGGEVFLQENASPTDALAGWDGTRPGGLNPTAGVYIYQVEVLLFTGEVVSIAGDVVVMR